MSFKPRTTTATIAATATSGSVALGATADSGQAVLVTNAGPNVAFVRLGVGAQTAVVTDFPVLPYTAILLEASGESHAGAICAATQTAAVYFTLGHEVSA